MRAAQRVTQRPPTYARESIRESLRVFGLVTEKLASGSSRHDRTYPSSASALRRNVSTSFEDMCAATGVSGAARLNSHVSCGNTMQCFASLFLPPTGWRIADLLDGGMIWQLSSNVNVVLYSWRVHVSTRFRSFLGLPAYTKIQRRSFSRWAQSVGNWTSARSLAGLERSLLQTDEPQHLPRVFFCNLTWLTPGPGGSLVALLDDDDNENDGECIDVKRRREPMVNSGGALGVHGGLLLDRKFSIIKHNNNCFQMIQGYMAHTADDGGAADAEYLRAQVALNSSGEQSRAFHGRFSTIGFTAGAGCDGFGFIGWKTTVSGAKFGVRFERDLLISSLLPSLRGFAENHKFDAGGYVCFATQPVAFLQTDCFDRPQIDQTW